MADTDPLVYRVQKQKPWYRRKWQVEYDDFTWCSRGYTRVGALAGARLRHRHPTLDRAYVRLRVIVRWVTDYDHGWYRERYTILGRSRADG